MNEKVNIDDLTLGQLKQISQFAGQSQANNDSLALKHKGKAVIVRTYSAGVHYGMLDNICGTEAVLSSSRRIWSWSGAFTLSKIASSGFSSAKLSVPVNEIVLTQAIEIIPCSEECIKKIDSTPSHNE